MPGIDKQCEGEGSTHHMACACRERYVARLEAALKRIQSTAGHPDAAEGCRLIIQLARKALGEK